ncbi:MAG: class I SAM-dependent methyltransferase [Agarilytica sp.]
MNTFSYILDRTEVLFRKIEQWKSRKALARKTSMWSALETYHSKTKSTGCSYIDYYELYKAIRRDKPTEVLECGTGVTTLIIAHAMMENEQETGVKGRVTSMEEIGEWMEMSRNLLATEYHPYVDFCLSDTVDDYISLFRGVRYRDIPKRDYDFVFVDGPKYSSPLDGVPTFDFDYIYAVMNSNKPVSAIIDKRVSTVFVLQQVLGVKKVKYSPIKGLGFVSSCTKKDLGELSRDLSSTNFLKSFKLFGRTVLGLSPLSRG